MLYDVYKKGNLRLKEFPFFVYEVEIYISTVNSFNLENTILIQKNEYCKEERITKNKRNHTILKDYKLKGAPKDWLLKNSYKI